MWLSSVGVVMTIDQPGILHLIRDGVLVSMDREKRSGDNEISLFSCFIIMLEGVKFSIYTTQEFIFLGMVVNICEIGVAVLSALYSLFMIILCS